MTTVLLTGATGFVGSRLRPVLERRGLRVRCLSRDAARAERRFPGSEWLQADLADPVAVRKAMQGCDAAYYLVHEMGSGSDYREREAAAARVFAHAAADAGLRRIIYLGGVAPGPGPASEHLRSRERVGEILSDGEVPVLELRASMIIGYGSLSFLIVRDLAARLPFMVLPRWLDSKTEPVAIDDVLVALVAALEIELAQSRAFDIPGPEILSGRDILLRTARALGLADPLVVRVPVLTPGLSARWVRFVTRARWEVAREIVVGLTHDLLAQDARYWGLIGHEERLHFDDAARAAIAEDHQRPPGFWGLIEPAMKRLRGRSS